ncbi:MAG: PIG-L deacetylase family protein [Chitinophagaceae bacterium]
MKIFCHLLLLILLLPIVKQATAQQKPLRILIIKAHPDEAEEYAGGISALYTARGNQVKFLSLTNGDVGHWKMSKTALAARRKKEAMKAGQILGVSYEILNNHDGELENNVALRKIIVRKIREWKADIVITFLPAFGGGHADNMAAAIAVQQGAGLTAAPLFMPEIPALAKTPFFFVMRDFFTKKLPHKPDIVIPIDSVIDKKIASWDAHASQFYEFAPWQRGLLNEVPTDSAGKRLFLEKYWGDFIFPDKDMKEWLTQNLGADKAAACKYAEAFEYAPYGRRPTKEELKTLFPFLYGKEE